MRVLRQAILVNLLFVAFAGFAFPGAVYLAGQVLFPDQAAGSLIYRSDGTVIGSKLIGQQFSAAKYFHPRPSAAGAGYDAANSSGTNLGPISSKLINGLPDNESTPGVDESYLGLTKLAESYRRENGLAADYRIPADAVTHSASGLDPQISVSNAILQAARVAKSRGMDPQIVLQAVRSRTEPRFLGIFGEPRVNVLQLNLDLDRLEKP
jgi:K+-transporting ATPase ATPase C chain